jgi:DNA processing protein
MNTPPASVDLLVPWLCLALAQGTSPREQRRALEAAGGSPSGALPLLKTRADVALVERTLAWAREPGHHCLTWADARYPAVLREIADPPLVLYAVGRLELLDGPAFAIVGSRNATPSGTGTARDIGRKLSQAGLAIVSGLALGIDAAAHEGGLAAQGSSIAVIGTGIDIVYPMPNAALARALMTRGLVISEFALGVPPLRENFPRRNRLISGLARGILVVEAAPHSGSLITAKTAIDQNRDVFAVPGSIHSPLSKGCHWLIREGATLVECANDILAALGMASDKAITPHDEPAGEADPVLAAMGFDPMSMDEISQRCGIGAAEAAARVSRLEIHGRVCSLPGGRFQQVKSSVIE